MPTIVSAAATIATGITTSVTKPVASVRNSSEPVAIRPRNTAGARRCATRPNRNNAVNQSRFHA